MIVSVNINNEPLYIDLFQRAYDALKEAGVDVEGNGQRFTSLDEYFSHMEDYLNINRYDFMLVPLDEEPCVIDANTRQIKVPAAFTKCAGVQNDHMAEMVTFVIDRYFDFIDLANMTIYVQWTAQEGNKPIEGASYISVIDRESVPGKIKFGWPLVKEFTQYAGNLKFSVRIFKRENDGTISYSFNTLPAFITISKALQPSVNLEQDAVNADDYFKAAVVNSMFPGVGVQEPLLPRFVAPGLNIKDKELVLEEVAENERYLKVQAIAGDGGDLNYKWYYSSDDGETWANISILEHGEANDQYQKVEGLKSLAQGEIYYIASSDSPLGYKVYTGKEIPAEDLYERYSVYSFPAEGDIVGKYKATATNSIGKATTGEVFSNIITLPGPVEINYTKDLPEHIILSGTGAEKLVVQANLGSDIKCAWYWAAVQSDNEGALLEGNTSNQYEVTEPGYYWVNTSLTQNRQTKSKFSKKAKVTYMPESPEIELEGEGGNISLADSVTFTLSVVNENFDNELYSEGISYQWQIQVADTDNDYRDLTEEDRVVKDGQEYIGKGCVEGDFNSNTITVHNRDDKYKTFRCIVTNHLNGEIAVTRYTNNNMYIN